MVDPISFGSNRECLHGMMGSDVSILQGKQKMGRIIASACLIALMSFRVCGQVAATPSVFEVASVRLNKTGIRGGSMDFSKGGERFY
jgi:hypothetical protein